MALVLDGRALAKQIEADLLTRVEALKAKSGRTPILATILVGDDGASATYVRMKGNACRRVGMDSLKVELPKETTTEQLLAEIEKLNANPDVHGILLQHPVPEQIDERACFDAISLAKDVDGVTCLGFGRMAMGEAAYGSATPAGIMTILQENNIEIAGKHAVVVGRSAILGRTEASIPLSSATRARKLCWKSSSPCIARSVISATCAPTPASIANSSITSCSIKVESMSKHTKRRLRR